MRHLRPLVINENKFEEELLDELKDAKFIKVGFIPSTKDWGIAYVKNGEKRELGGFKSIYAVHDFLTDNNIEYGGKESHLMAKKFMDSEISKIPLPKYQRYLINNGIDDMIK